MNITDANSRMSRDSKIKYYVELPIPQEVNDSNTVTWGEDTMNIFQLQELLLPVIFNKMQVELFNKV